MNGLDFPRFRRVAAVALAATLAFAAATAAQPAAEAAVPVSPGDDFLWSGDGSTLLAFERDAERGLLAVRAFDGGSGAPRWELGGEPLAAFARGAAPGAPLAAAVAADGSGLLLGRGGRWWLWRAAEASFAAAPELDGAADPRFAPDGSQVAFVRAGDLWTYALAAPAVRQLTADGDAWHDGEVPPAVRRRADSYAASGYEWSSDGHRLAFYRWQASGTVRVAVLDLVDPAPRDFELETTGSGLAVGWTWRFDARAVGVLWLPQDRKRLELRLCHPERLYCRPLASRSWSAQRELLDDFRFLDDGFLWGSGASAGASLAYYDTLGRERSSLVAGELRRLGVVAVLEPTRELVVAVERASEAVFVRMLLIDLRNGATQEIAAAPGGPPVAISATQRAWVRPRKDAQGHFDGNLLARLDGTVLRRFD